MIESMYLKNAVTEAELIQLVVKTNYKKDIGIVTTNLQVREQQGSTLISPKLAMPHIISNDILKSSVTIVRLENSIFDYGIKHEQVDAVICIILAASDSKENLKQIKKLVVKFANDELCNKLINCTEVEFNEIVTDLKRELKWK